MAVSKSQFQDIIQKITGDVEQSYAGLSLYFVMHGDGKMREAFALAEHEIISHEAGDAARTIIRNHKSNGKSGFVGLAIGQEKKFLGLKKIDHVLGIFNINHDDFKDENEARAEIYALTWHAIDLHEIRQHPKYKNKFAKGPMVPKRSDINFAKASLQADVFAVTFSALHKEESLLSLLSTKRAQDSISIKNDSTPDKFASVIAMDACKAAVENIDSEQSAADSIIKIARKLSVEVGHAFDVDSIKQWWNFTIPAQDMAWRNFSKEDILGAAIHTSTDPYVRSVGYLVQEVTGITPSDAEDLKHTHNAFIDEKVLASIHKEMVDTIFEDAVNQGIKEASNRPFLNAANRLNEALTEGHILGWCSNALHDSAQAFDRALLNGASPEQAARMQFDSNKSHPKWEALKSLATDIINQKREGYAVTMGHVAEIAHSNPDFSPVLDSIKMTMKDPSYVQKLDAANDLNITPNIPKAPSLGPKTPAPNAPTPNAPTLNAPAPQSPMMAPSLGGSSRGAQIAHQRNIAAQQQQKNSSSSTQGDDKR